MSTRINKFLSETGVTSRRGGDAAVTAGRVTIDGRTATLGDTVNPGQVIRLDGQVVSVAEKHYLIFNKPVGIITTTDDRSRDNIMQALEKAGWPVKERRVFPVGRLDVASSGLILMTNDSEVSERLLRKEGRHEKEYLVTVDEPVSEEAYRTWERGGMEMLGQRLLPAKIRPLKPDHFSMTIVQGLNRQIRRMCEAFGYRIVSLKRVRILNLHLDRLQSGEFRGLLPKEVKELRQAVGLDVPATDRRGRGGKPPTRSATKSVPKPKPRFSISARGKR